MECVKGRPRGESVLPRMLRVAMGRYSVRHPVEWRGAEAAARARVEGGRGSRIGKRGAIFAIYSPLHLKIGALVRHVNPLEGGFWQAEACRAILSAVGSRIPLRKEW